jgi:hypothetical protein
LARFLNKNAGTVSPRQRFNFMEAHVNHKAEFRFFPDEIAEIAAALLPPKVRTSGRHTCERTVALCVVLRTLAYPERLDRTAAWFGQSKSWTSSVFNATLALLYTKAQMLLRQFSPGLEEEIPEMAATVLEKFGFNAWAFLDGTKVFIPRPSQSQVLAQMIWYSDNFVS